MKRFLLLLMISAYTPAALPCARGWSIIEMSPILIPVFFEGNVSGGFGSVWDTELRVFTGRWGWRPYIGGDCGAHFPWMAPVGPKMSFEPVLQGNDSNPSRLLYVVGDGYKRHPDAHWYNARIRDLSRRLETAGTEIPVVTEDELLTARTQLLNVPVRPEFRSTLRVYDPDGRGDGQVRVRIFPLESESPPLVDHTMSLLVLKEPSHYSEDPQPGFAQLTDLTSLLKTSVPALRIEIEPLTPGLRYWAFVSVTNNTTQHVTLVTPH